jgi:transposase InsO family protein
VRWVTVNAYVGMRNFYKLQIDGHIIGLTNIIFKKDRSCGACQVRKQFEIHHHDKNIMTTTVPLKMLHIDLFGLVPYISIDGNKYGIVIVDDYSRFIWMFFLQDKSETQYVLKKFLRRAQNEFDAKVKKIRNDSDTEFKNTQVEDFLDEEGIKNEFLTPYTPQQNRVAEIKNRTLIEMVRTVLDKASDRFWVEVINMVCHATNRLYLHKLLKKTSYEFLTGNKLSVSHF